MSYHLFIKITSKRKIITNFLKVQKETNNSFIANCNISGPIGFPGLQLTLEQYRVGGR